MLTLPPEPRSVPGARRFVSDLLGTLGREDLVHSAALSVSEVVTNAILHAQGPIDVRLAGTQTQPRVEVRDSSSQPPAVHGMSQDARLLATVGRGLQIVATYSRRWGAELSDTGKVVWFEPVPDVTLRPDAAPVPGDVFALGELVGDDAGEPAERITIRLLGMPAQVFAHYRVWYDELRREMRLLAFSDDADDFPVARELTRLTLQVEKERRAASGTAALTAAIVAGQESVDLTYEVPPTVPATMAQLRLLLGEADAFCREQRLLLAETSDQLKALRSWYLGEFERQGRGEAPLPWPGGYSLVPATP